MAMVECSECKGRVSGKAWRCPHCGKPETKIPVWPWHMVSVFSVLGFVNMMIVRGNAPIDAAARRMMGKGPAPPSFSAHPLSFWILWLSLWGALGVACIIRRWNSRV